MKKVFAFMAIAATILAVSCKKNDPKPGPGPDPEDPEDPEYVMPITIDGDFSDWAKLDASKMVVAQSAEGATKEALKVVKVYADEFFVFVYFEWDKDQISYEPDVEHVPFHVYINGDNDFTTGGYADQWADAAFDIMLEGSIYPTGESVGAYEPSVFRWSGEPNASGWTWEDVGEIAGITSGAGIEGKYEFYINRSLYPGTFADQFTIGFDIQQSWNSVGILPNAASSEEDPSGLAPSLVINTNK